MLYISIGYLEKSAMLSSAMAIGKPTNFQNDNVIQINLIEKRSNRLITQYKIIIINEKYKLITDEFGKEAAIRLTPMNIFRNSPTSIWSPRRSIIGDTGRISKISKRSSLRYLSME